MFKFKIGGTGNFALDLDYHVFFLKNAIKDECFPLPLFIFSFYSLHLKCFVNIDYDNKFLKRIIWCACSNEIYDLSFNKNITLYTWF